MSGHPFVAIHHFSNFQKHFMSIGSMSLALAEINLKCQECSRTGVLTGAK